MELYLEVLAWIPALIGAAATIGGGIMSASGAAGANAANIQSQNMANQQMLNAQMAQHEQNTAFMEDAQAHQLYSQGWAQDVSSIEAQKNRDWQQMMYFQNMSEQTRLANTAYQRSMEDMRRAGLNPMLAYQQGGASMATPSTGGGAQGSGSAGSAAMASGAGAPSLHGARSENTQAELGRAIGNAVSSAVDTQKTLTGVDLMKEQTRRVGYETSQLDAQTGKTVADTNVSKQQERNLQVENAILKANAVTAAQNARTAAADADASARYGGQDAPSTVERIMRSIQDAFERGVEPRPLPPNLFK